MKEIWRDIPGHSGYYQVSDLGKVRSFKKRGAAKGKLKVPFLLKPSKNNKGYLRVRLWANHKYERHFIHRLVAMIFIPIPEGKHVVNHKNRNREDNKVSKLEWCTYHENVRHAVQTGLMTEQIGSGNHASRLTESDVIMIRRLYKTTNLSQKEVADKFGVSQMSVSKIIRRETWV